MLLNIYYLVAKLAILTKESALLSFLAIEIVF